MDHYRPLDWFVGNKSSHMRAEALRLLFVVVEMDVGGSSETDGRCTYSFLVPRTSYLVPRTLSPPHYDTNLKLKLRILPPAVMSI